MFASQGGGGTASRLRLASAAAAALAHAPGAAAASGGGISEAGFLQTPTYTLAIVLLFFLVVSMLFEKGTHALVAFFRRHKRSGLAAATSNLVMELTLVGFVSLLLLAFQDELTALCVSYSPSSYSAWSLLANVAGCDCCLGATAGVNWCFRDERSCGVDFCNCTSPGSPPPAPYAPALAPAAGAGRRLLSGAAAGAARRRLSSSPSSSSPASDAACAPLYTWKDVETASAAGGDCSCGLPYLGAAYDALPAAVQLQLDPTCVDGLLIDTEKCGDGQTPAITLTALHQVHIFIFVIALTHVLMGIILILLASWRVLSWRDWRADDEHSLEAKAALSHHWRTQRQPSRGKRPIQRLMTLPSRFRHGLARGIGIGDAAAADAAADGAGADAPAPAGVGGAAEEAAQRMEEGALPTGGTAGGGSGATVPVTSAGGAGGTGAAAALSSAASKRASRRRIRFAGAGGEAGEQGPGESPLAGGSTGGSSSPPAPPTLPEAPEAPGEPASADPEEPGVQEARSEPPLKPRTRATLQRQGSIQSRRGWSKEYAICLLLQFLPWGDINRQQYGVLRASFLLTHRTGPAFDFNSYIELSMEDDFSQVVGISVEMWLVMIVFLIISGPLGWAAIIFLCLAAAVLLTVNTKLTQIIRHVCRHGRAAKLASNVFWFHRPPLLLPVIKMLLFLCSFVFSTAVFAAWQFGPHSCFFTSEGFWWAWVLPWWMSLLFSGAIFLVLSLRTLPLYSLAVQMGSDFKRHMLPKGIKLRLLKMAVHVRQKHREQAAAEAAAAGKRGGDLTFRGPRRGGRQPPEGGAPPEQQRERQEGRQGQPAPAAGQPAAVTADARPAAPAPES